MLKSFRFPHSIARLLALLLILTLVGFSAEALYARPGNGDAKPSATPQVQEAMPDEEDAPTEPPAGQEAMPDEETSPDDSDISSEARVPATEVIETMPDEEAPVDSHEGTRSGESSSSDESAKADGVENPDIHQAENTKDNDSDDNILVEENYTNSATNYGVLVYDEAELFKAEDIQKLVETMKPITSYENAYVFTLTNVKYDVEKAALKLAREFFDKQPGTIFVIDMEHRRMRLLTLGYTERILSDSKAKSIVANVYTFASDDDYYGCVNATMQQVLTLLEGGAISEPMKHASNALLALSTALLLGFYIVNLTAHKNTVTSLELLEGLQLKPKFTNTKEKLVRTERHYDPQSSSDSSSGGSSGGGSSSSGSGASHSF